MPTDRWTAPAEADEDAYEDAWYRALKAKASQRFAAPEKDTTDASPAAPEPPTPDAKDEPERGSTTT